MDTTAEEMAPNGCVIAAKPESTWSRSYAEHGSDLSRVYRQESGNYRRRRGSNNDQFIVHTFL